MKKILTLIVICLSIFFLCSCESNTTDNEIIGGKFTDTNYYILIKKMSHEYFNKHWNEETEKIKEQIPNIDDKLLIEILNTEFAIEEEINKYGSDYYEKLFQIKEEKAKENGMTYEEYILHEERVTLIDNQGTIKKDENSITRCFILNGHFIIKVTKKIEEAEACDWYGIPFHITYDDLFVLTYDFNYYKNLYQYYYNEYRLNIYRDILISEHTKKEQKNIKSKIIDEIRNKYNVDNDILNNLLLAISNTELEIEKDYTGYIENLNNLKQSAKEQNMSLIEYNLRTTYKLDIDDFSIEKAEEILAKENEVVRIIILNDDIPLIFRFNKTKHKNLDAFLNLPRYIYYEDLYKVTDNLNPTIEDLENSEYANRIK